MASSLAERLNPGELSNRAALYTLQCEQRGEPVPDSYQIAKTGELFATFPGGKAIAIEPDLTVREIEPTPGKKPAPEKFNLVAAADFLNRPRIDWIIKGVLPGAGIVVIQAPPGHAKTTLAVDLAVSLTTGKDWQGHRNGKRRRVVYVAAEDAPGVGARLHAKALHDRVPFEDLPAIIDDVPDLKSAEDAAMLAHKIGTADVIFFDTLAASFVGNESGSEDMGAVLKHCKWLQRKTGATIVLLAHPGKNVALGIRGWSGMLGAIDTELTITRNGDHRRVTITKQKGGLEGLLMNFTLKVVPLGQDAEGEPISSVVIEKSTAPVREKSPEPQFVGVNQSAIKSALDRLAGPANAASVRDVLRCALNHYAPHDAEDGEAVSEKKKSLKKALDQLVAKRLVFAHGPDRVALSEIVEAGDWDPPIVVNDLTAEAELQAAIKPPRARRR